MASMAASQSPVEQLLEINQEILGTEATLAREKILRRAARISVILGPAGALAIYVATVVTWRKFDLAVINLVAIPSVLAMSFYGITYFADSFSERGRSVEKIELQLSLLRERKRLRSAEMALNTRYRRSAYKEESTFDVRRFRSESTYYRRIHNILQSTIIVGSLATSTVAGLSVQEVAFRWGSVGSGFLVGIAAGFTGYFKFRERSFYLQQTADSIEAEWHAVELGVGRYKNRDEEIALLDFVEEVERLKTEQRKREQNLEQPPEGREAGQ